MNIFNKLWRYFCRECGINHTIEGHELDIHVMPEVCPSCGNPANFEHVETVDHPDVVKSTHEDEHVDTKMANGVHEE